jgi:hypothetical protein
MEGQRESVSSASGASGAMERGGYYAEHSAPQAAYGSLAIAWLEAAAREVEPPRPGDPLVVADLGAADGGNSLRPMRRAVAALRERFPTPPVLVVHTDIPSNDFSALFELIEHAPESYLCGPAVFALAAGRSFYERLLPDRFLSLAWSSIAVHWLSRVPEPIHDHIYSSFATGSARDSLRDQSAADWQAFLAHRAAELRTGGSLIVTGGAAADDGTSGAEGLMAMANDALAQLEDTGELRSAERERITIPTWNRTAAEFLAPFDSRPQPDGLDLRRHTFCTLPDSYLNAYEQDGDVDRYTTAVADFFRAAFEPSLWAQLDQDRDASERKQLAAGFHERLRAKIAADPGRAATSWHVMAMEISRR